MRRLLSILMLLLSLCPLAPAQCPQPVPDTLAREGFEAGLPASWSAPPASQGASWQVDTGTIGYYENPGSGAWLFIDDEAANNVGTASVTTSTYDLSGYQEGIQLSFLLNFQQFADSGQMFLDLWHLGRWQVLWQPAGDFKGQVTIDLSEYAGWPVQFRFRYEDEGAWTWGMGIDDFALTALPNPCGNGHCDPGESYVTCPGDCAAPPQPAPTWVAPGRDLTGQAVGYRPFKGGTACDDCSEAIDLGFVFDFYGHPYEQVFLNANGNLSFEAPFTEYQPEAFCLDGPRMIAPFYADVDLAAGGSIQYYQDPAGHYLIVRWEAVGYYGCEADCPLRNSFQVVLTDGQVRQVGTQVLPFGTTILFTYDDMQWTTGAASGGVGGFGGTAATVGVNLGDGIICEDYGTFDQPGYAYYGNSQEDACPPNRVSHLDHRWLAFNGSEGQVATSGQRLFLQVVTGPHGHQLSWQTDHPEGEGAYVVLCKVEGDPFYEVGRLLPADHLDEASHRFQYLVPEPPPGLCTYQVEFRAADGSMAPSEPVTVAAVAVDPLPAAGGITLSAVGPNPFADHLDITYQSEHALAADYVLADMSGRVLAQGHVTAGPGPQRLRLQTGSLPAGMYVLTFFYEEGLTHRRLVKN